MLRMARKQDALLTLLFNFTFEHTISKVLENQEGWEMDNKNSWSIKVKLSLCLTKHHAMKTYRGSEDIAPYILDLSMRWR
jgi:hypothetical protein